MSHPSRPESKREERDRPQPPPDRDRDQPERKDFPGKRADEGERPQPEKIEPERPWPRR
jgi:hypothetical protein